MAIQWTIVCLQDQQPTVVGNTLDCSAGTTQVVPFKYLSPDEQSLGSLLSLSNADAYAISFAMISVWAVAWGIKQAIHVMKDSSNVQDE